MSNLNSGRRIAMVNVQCSIMIPLIRFTKLRNRPTGMDFDLKVVPKNNPSFRYFWQKILDVYFTGLLRQKAEIELGIEQELDMGYCDEAERVLDTGTVTLLEKVLDTGNFSLIRAEVRQWNSFLWPLYLSFNPFDHVSNSVTHPSDLPLVYKFAKSIYSRFFKFILQKE